MKLVRPSLILLVAFLAAAATIALMDVPLSRKRPEGALPTQTRTIPKPVPVVPELQKDRADQKSPSFPGPTSPNKPPRSQPSQDPLRMHRDHWRNYYTIRFEKEMKALESYLEIPPERFLMVRRLISEEEEGWNILMNQWAEMQSDDVLPDPSYFTGGEYRREIEQRTAVTDARIRPWLTGEAATRYHEWRGRYIQARYFWIEE